MIERTPPDLWEASPDELGEYFSAEVDAAGLGLLFNAYHWVNTRFPIVPELLMRRFAQYLDSFPQETKTQALIAAAEPVYRMTMRLAVDTRQDTVPSKDERKNLAQIRLAAATNIALLERHAPKAIQYPGNSVRLAGTPTQYDYSPQLMGIPTSDLDMFKQQAWKNLRLPGGGGFDWWFQRHIYPKKPIDTTELHQRANTLALNEKPTKPSPEVVKRICFLGMENEEEFISVTEASILSMAHRLKMDTDRIAEAMTFSKISDEYRRKQELDKNKKPPEQCGRRKTGEAYYCHPLSGTWIHLTSIEAKVKAGLISPEDATRDVVCFLLHDVKEDTPAEFDSSSNTLYLGKTGIKLQPEEFVVLESLTKKITETDWLTPILEQSPKLAEVCARLKLTDRLMNLLTMRYTGSYTDVLGKMIETVYVGGHIQEYASGLFKGGSFVEQMSKLKNAMESNALDYMLAALPAIAITEAQIVEMEFGQQFFREIQSSAMQNPDSDLAHIMEQYYRLTQENASQILANPTRSHLIETFNRSVIKEQNKGTDLIPPWLTRALYLDDIHKFSRSQREDIRGLPQIREFGIEHHFATSAPQKKPFTYEFLVEHINRCVFFQLYYRSVPGLMLGNDDAFIIPANR